MSTECVINHTRMHLYTHITRNFDECVICRLVFDNVCGCFARLDEQLDMHVLHECTHARTQTQERTRARAHTYVWRVYVANGYSCTYMCASIL